MTSTHESVGNERKNAVPLPRAMLDYLYDNGPSPYWEVARDLSQQSTLEGVFDGPDDAIEILNTLGLAVYGNNGRMYSLTEAGSKLVSGLREA